MFDFQCVSLNHLRVILVKLTNPFLPLRVNWVWVVFIVFTYYTAPSVTRALHNLSQLMRLWYFNSSNAHEQPSSGARYLIFGRPFVYFHTSCVRTAKALARPRGYVGSPDHSLVAYVISYIISWAGSFVKLMILGWYLSSPWQGQICPLMPLYGMPKEKLLTVVCMCQRDQNLFLYRHVINIADPYTLCFTSYRGNCTIWATSWQNQQNECAPSEDSDQSGHSPSLIRVFAVRSVGS